MTISRKLTLGDSPVLFSLFLLLLFWIPIPFGSNDPGYWALMEVWIYGLAAIWLWKYARGRVNTTRAFVKSKYLLILLGVWLVYGLVQIISLPHEIVTVLSPKAAQDYQQAYLGMDLAGKPLTPAPQVGEVTGELAQNNDSNVRASDPPTLLGDAHTRAVFPSDTQSRSVENHPITLDRSASWVEWLKSLAYVLFFALTLLLVDSHKRLRMLANVLVISGLVQAVYGSLILVKTGETEATGTFINRNHYAGYLVLCLSVGIGLLIASMQRPRESAQSWKNRLRHVAQWIMSPKAPLRIFLAIMVIAIVLTHSRMGNASFFASMLIAGVAALILYKKTPRPTVLLLTSLIVFDIVIIGSYVGLDKVRERLEQTTMETESRDNVDMYTLQLIKDYPLLGSGAGSFYGVFPRYSGADVSSGYWDRAHNEYFEILGDYGFIGIGLLGSIVALALGNALIAQRKRNSSLMQGMGFAATMGITAMLIHAAVEFNLHIPAYAGTFMVLLAIAGISRHVDLRNV